MPKPNAGYPCTTVIEMLNRVVADHGDLPVIMNGVLTEVRSVSVRTASEGQFLNMPGGQKFVLLR